MRCDFLPSRPLCGSTREQMVAYGSLCHHRADRRVDVHRFSCNMMKPPDADGFFLKSRVLSKFEFRWSLVVGSLGGWWRLDCASQDSGGCELQLSGSSCDCRARRRELGRGWARTEVGWECIFVMDQLRQFLRREMPCGYGKDCGCGIDANEERSSGQGNGYCCADAVGRLVEQRTKQGCESGASGFSDAGRAFHGGPELPGRRGFDAVVFG